MIGALNFLVSALAVYYAADAISQRDGPAGVFARLRARWDTGYLGKGVRCIICVSAWAALPVTIGLGVLGYADPWAWPIVWLGLSGGAVLIDKVWKR